jgi:uncharacterized Zn finger protein
MNNKCPVCGSNKHTTIHASGSEWASLIINQIGSVSPNVCLECGTVYLNQFDLERLRKKGEER